MNHDRSRPSKTLSTLYSPSKLSILPKIQTRLRCTCGQTDHSIHGLRIRRVTFDSFQREKLTLSKAADFYIKHFNHNTVSGIERGRTTTLHQLIWAKRQVFSFAGVSIHAQANPHTHKHTDGFGIWSSKLGCLSHFPHSKLCSD